MKSRYYSVALLGILCSHFFTIAASGQSYTAGGQPVHEDRAFRQNYSVKYFFPGIKEGEDDDMTNGKKRNKRGKGLVGSRKVFCDRNGVIEVLDTSGLLRTSGGQFLYPGRLVPDLSYRPFRFKKIKDLTLVDSQFVYLDDKSVFSNAWAGKLFVRHGLPYASMFSAGRDFRFLVSDGHALQYVDKTGVLWQGHEDDEIRDIRYEAHSGSFWILGEHGLYIFSPANKSLEKKFSSEEITCFAPVDGGKTIIAGTHQGYIRIDAATGRQSGDINDRLPWNDISFVGEIDGKTWFGGPRGAFMLKEDGKFDYYASQRWIPSDDVVHISGGGKSVLVLTGKGLGELHFESITLEDKALYYEREVRARHIRHGFNATISRMRNGDPTTGVLEDSDNDGLWTSMYLGAEIFRYAATHSPEALQNCRESMDAMERLYSINHIPGFPSRSFERRGYKFNDPDAWRRAEDPEWDWKSTTSSDEAIGHIFVFGAMAELVDDADLKHRAIRLIDTLMGHIVKNKLYMIDWNGQPTRWGRWNPEYTNARPPMVGDRKITSSNIMAMLQTAYHFTHKEIYKQTAFDLIEHHGYLENLMRPMKDIGEAPPDADELSRDLSNGWNHSDDEMYFLGYWGLYRYALNDTLKEKYKEAILDHWQAERPEKEGAWNLFTGMMGVKEFDLKESVWYLQKYPLDLVTWRVKNSDRNDITKIAANFRRQTITEVLPPDELEISRHNSNRFDLDGGNGGREEYSAGDIWLLPYWLGRYMKVISGADPAGAERSLDPAGPLYAAYAAEGPLKKEPSESGTGKAGGREDGIKGDEIKEAGKTYQDKPFLQDYSIKYTRTDSSLSLLKVAADRNGNVQVLTDKGLWKPRAGQVLVPGELVKDLSYRPITDKKISALGVYEDQFIYADDKAVLSNAWAGKIYIPHSMPGANRVEAGKDFGFLVTDGRELAFVKDSVKLWSGRSESAIIDIRYQAEKNVYWILSAHSLSYFSPANKKLVKAYSAPDNAGADAYTCFAILANRAVLGTGNGYLEVDLSALKQKGPVHRQLPAVSLTAIREINGHLWFGSTKGAFKLRADGKFDYYASRRWLSDNKVIDLAGGKGEDVWILTSSGLTRIAFEPMDLYRKARYYETIIRQRHIRYGFYVDYANLKKGGEVSSSEMVPHDSDNLWTAMYMGAELFRYLVTHDPEARQNCVESFEAMERLHNIHTLHGFFGRSFERVGAVKIENEYRKNIEAYWYPGYVNSVSWHEAADGEWDWRGASSSDQADGQYFALTLMAQYMDDKGLRDRAIELIDRLTGYIVDNDLTLIDTDGKPTLWGIWNPYYVNRIPKMVGDRKLYSSNIISYLQTAYHFTGKEKYKSKALELLYKDGYLDNLTLPVSKLGNVPDTADAWSKELSGGWNYSDNEMYFLGYWGLTPYALDEGLKKKYAEAIRDHWNGERPLKDGLWNLMYGDLTGAASFDLGASIWNLREMPLDLIYWNIENSSRKDVQFLPANFREQHMKEVLPPDERPENKHNRNWFDPDGREGNGGAELGGGDTYLLPYWLGRYMGAISAPGTK